MKPFPRVLLVETWTTMVALGLLGTTLGCGRASRQPAASSAESAAPAAAAASEMGESAGYAVSDLPSGTVQGEVVLEGKAPPPREIAANQDVEFCGARHVVYPVKLEDGGISEAVVSIEEIRQGKAFSFSPATLDQKKCMFEPHIVLMAPGDLAIHCSDRVPHNIHTYAESNRNINESMNSLNADLTARFTRPEIIPVRCDLHGWMKAYVVVASNPYYVVTGRGGTFRLDGVPAGKYRLKAWQETLGQLEKDITVEAGRTTEANFTFQVSGQQAAANQNR